MTDTMAEKIACWLETREIARKAGDPALVRSISRNLRRYGVEDDDRPVTG